MTWVRIDDTAWSHPKVVGLTDAAFRAWIIGLSWSSHHATDGAIPRAATKLMGATAEVVDQLVDAGLWVATADGWQVHDWAEYQRSRADVEAWREAGKERAARSSRRRRESETPESFATSSREENAKRARSFATSSRDPSPSPSSDLTPPTTTSTLGDVRAREAAVVAPHASDPRIGRAVALLVDIAERQAIADGNPPRRPAAWRARVTTRLLTDHGPLLCEAAARAPDATPTALANLVLTQDDRTRHDADHERARAKIAALGIDPDTVPPLDTEALP